MCINVELVKELTKQIALRLEQAQEADKNRDFESMKRFAEEAVRMYLALEQHMQYVLIHKEEETIINLF